jgi:hypothetical protein
MANSKMPDSDGIAKFRAGLTHSAQQYQHVDFVLVLALPLKTVSKQLTARD